MEVLRTAKQRYATKIDFNRAAKKKLKRTNTLEDNEDNVDEDNGSETDATNSTNYEAYNLSFSDDPDDEEERLT